MGNVEDYKRAIAEAERFIDRAKIAIVDLERYDRGRYYYSGKNTAAAKRASMDLTRALVYIRR